MKARDVMALNETLQRFTDESDLIEGITSHKPNHRVAVDFAWSTTVYSFKSLHLWHSCLHHDLEKYCVPGKFRSYPVTVGGSTRNADNIASRVNALIEEANELRDGAAAGKYDVEAIHMFAGMLHYDYEIIHPYGDGNGRTGRMFILPLYAAIGVLPPIFDNATKREEYYPLFTGSPTDGRAGMREYLRKRTPELTT